MDAKSEGKELPVEVRGSPTRCPYCHDEAAAAADAWVCQDCLARHHAACWRERGACSSCASTRHLEPPARPPLTVERAREVFLAAGHDPADVIRFLAPLTPTQLAVDPIARATSLAGRTWFVVFLLWAFALFALMVSGVQHLPDMGFISFVAVMLAPPTLVAFLVFRNAYRSAKRPVTGAPGPGAPGSPPASL
jgi:hypothetical protein